MKLIKSMLALAAAVFIGTSAQAEDITLKIGESVTRTCTYSGDRWWKVYDGDAAIASAAFETPATQYAGTDYEGLVSVKQGNNFAVTFTGVRVGTTTWQTTTYTDAGQMAGGDAPGYETARVGYPSGTTYGGTSGNQWGNSKGTYTITVVDPDMPDDVEAVALKVGGTKEIALSGGDATTEWTTLVKGNENDSVELDQTEATGAAFNATISALATGAATVIVKKDGVPFKAYEVTVSIDTDTNYHLAKGDTVRLGYRSGSSNGNSWTATITGSGASATPTSGSNRNFATTVTAEGEGAAHVKVTLTRNGSATTQDDRDIEIDAKRVVYVGKSAQYGLYSPLSANWAVPAVAAGAIASAKYVTSGQNSAIVEIAGKSVGETTVTAGNANNNNQGAAYTLAVEVRDIPQPAEGKYPVLTMNQTPSPSFALSVLNGELKAIAMVDSNGNPVEGEWAWVNPSEAPAIGTFEYEAKFTPEGDYYDVVTAKIPVKAQTVKDENEGDPLTLTVGGETAIEEPDWTEDWTAASDDETIATVPASGEMGVYPVVTAVAPGKTKVVVEDSDTRWTYEVTVRAADQKGVLELMLNGTGTYRCTSAVAAAWTAVSSDEGVVTVTAEGEESEVFTPTFTAVAAGTATVTVKNEFASYTIAVTVLPYESGKVNLAVGDSVVMADNSGKSTQQTLRETDKRFFQVTLEGEGVTVSPDGINYPSNHFVKTTITATEADKAATVTVRRSSSVRDGELQPTVQLNNTYQIATVEARTVNVGETVKAYCFSNQGNAWTAESSDPETATVTASGAASSVFLPEITALKEGEVTITVSNMADQNDKAEFPKGATYTLKVKVVVPYITINIVNGEGVKDVQTNSVSVVGELELPAGTKQVELTLEANVGLTVPVFKVVRGNETNVTTKVATYDIKDGDTLEFFAEEAEWSDPDVTDDQIKTAIKEAIDPANPDDPDDVDRYNNAVKKVDNVVGTDANQVSAKDLAAYINENKIKSDDIADCDYVAASVKLDTDDLITEETEVKIAELVKAEGDALTFEVDIDNVQVEVEAIKDMVEASSDLTDWEKNKLEVEAEFDPDEYKVTITPMNPTDKAFMRVVIPQDPGVK